MSIPASTAVSTVKLAKLFGVPVVLSTINVAGGSARRFPSSPSSWKTTRRSTA
jgi:hypothetical protein